MSLYGEHNVLSLLVLDDQVRCGIIELLRKNGFVPIVMSDADESIETLKGKSDGVLFLDWEAVRIFGVGIYTKVRVACQGFRVVLLCDQAHRDLIKEAMELGAYGCILEPYPEWEVLTMVKHILSDAHPRRERIVKKGKESKERRKISRKEQ
jgi:FixJ family two-component response regulator